MSILEKYLKPTEGKTSILDRYLVDTEEDPIDLGRELSQRREIREANERLASFEFKPGVDPNLQAQLVRAGREDEIKGLQPVKEHAKMISSPFWAGVGDVAKTAGEAAKFIGFEATGEKLRKYGGEVSGAFTDEEALQKLGEFDVKDLLEPSFYHQKVFRTLPFALSLIPVSLIGAYGGTAIAGKIGLGALGRLVLGSIGAASASRPIESAMEAGGVYQEAIDRGMSEEIAKKAAKEAFSKNLSLAGMDAIEFATAFLPTKKIPFLLSSKAFKGIVGKTIGTVGKLAATGAMEATEEILQDKFSKEALGDKFSLKDPSTREAGAIGGIFGVALGGAGDIFTRIQTKVIENLPQDLKIEFESEKEKIFQDPNENQQSAQTKALDKVTEKNQEQVKAGVGEFLREEFKDDIKKESPEVQKNFIEFMSKEFGVTDMQKKPIKLKVEEKVRVTEKELIPASLEDSAKQIEDVKIGMGKPEIATELRAIDMSKITTLDELQTKIKETIKDKESLRVIDRHIETRRQMLVDEAKKEVTGVPTFEPIEGTGKVKKSKFFKRLEKQAPELIQNIREEDKTYTALENKVDMEISEQAVMNDYDNAVKMARGEAKRPAGTTESTFLYTVMERARELGDTATQNSILVKLRVTGTVAGQTVQAFKNIPKDSATYFKDKAVETRVRKVGKTKSKIVDGKLETKGNIDKIIETKRKELSKKINKKVSETTKAQDIINSLLC